MKIKNICCIGAGYVGGPTMAVIALKCPDIKINVVDISKEKIRAWNSKDLNEIPVKEPGLSDIVKEVRNKNLFFSNEVEKNIDKAEMIFIAVNTPTKTSGKGKGMAADLKYVINSAKTIAKSSRTDKIIVEKSTLPVRTAEKIKKILNENNSETKFEVLSNPEFLAEGTAINDLFKSDRVLIGGDDTDSGKKAINSLKKIYSRWIPDKKIIITNVWSSELSKLASNAMLAQRISSINSLSALCRETDADIDEVSKVIGLDKRIGPEFLKASVGFGGSCFQKDILNLVYICKSYGLHEVAHFWEQVIKINDYQKNRFSDLIINKSKKNKSVTLLGWAFKKDTNDSRESASIYVTRRLLDSDFDVKVYDPLVKKDQITLDLRVLFESLNYSDTLIKKKLKKLKIFSSANEAIKGSEVISILTEWDEFKDYDWNLIAKNKKLTIVDGRNILTKLKLNDNNINYIKL
jgi:UDPglucose 6-dehydrogenase